MKYSKFTYYLLTILCSISVSCTNAELTDDIENGNLETAESVNVQLTINFPVSTRSETGTSDGTTSNGEEYERYINDIRIFAFTKDEWGFYTFAEEARNIITDTNDGHINRVVYATLTKSNYTSGPVSIVAIANSRARGVNDISLTKASYRRDLYQQLLFEYNEPEKWFFKSQKYHIPMWGETQIENLSSNNNIKSLQLRRAIAKIGITMNSGKGLSNFKINEVRLYNYNDQGYCTPYEGHEYTGTLFIPRSATQVTDKPIVINNLSKEESNKTFTDRIYIPEQNNTGADNSGAIGLKKLYLIIETTVNGKAKTYQLDFKKKDAHGVPQDYDIYRNHSYIFNITSVKSDEPDANVGLDYEVKDWDDNIEIDIPSFD